MYQDKRALVDTLRHYKRHILGPIFTEAADTIEEVMKDCDALKRDNANLRAVIAGLGQEIEELAALTKQTEEVHCGDACEIGGSHGQSD